MPGLVLLYVLLFLNFVRLPKIAVDMTHDLGSHMTFEYYAYNKAQWGVDVIQNVGPYGYLNYPYDYSGILPTPKLLFGIFFGLTLAWYALDARRYFYSTAGKIIWFLSMFLALVTRYEELDPISGLFMLLAAHQLLIFERDRPRRFVSDAVLCFFLGLMALMKSTNVMLVFALAILIVVERIRTRRFLDLACNLGCLGATTLGLWILAGQKISNAGAFMSGAAAFSKGYNEALSMAGRPEMVWLALVVVALFAAMNILRLVKFRTYHHRLLTAAFEAACLFIIWKHGHVRAGHEAYFWAFIIQAAPLLFMAHEAPPSGRNLGGATAPGSASASLMRGNISIYRLAKVSVAVIFLCAVGAAEIQEGNINFTVYENPVTAVVGPVQRMSANLGELADWPGHLAALKASLEHNRDQTALPQVKAAVGNATIDMFGYLPGLILLNDLNYKPRPMPINFAATTKVLMERNAEFYRNDNTAPAFILANIGQIDGRFAPQDDAIALPEVLDHYQPVLIDHGFLLLKRTPGRPDLVRTFLYSRTIAWDESIPIPSTGTNQLWCSADIKFSLLGRALSFLFQPAQLFIVLESPDHRLGPVRLLQSGAGAGFLLRPLIINGIDFLAAYGMHAEPVSMLTPSFDHMRFLIKREDQAFFEPGITVSFWSMEPKK